MRGIVILVLGLTGLVAACSGGETATTAPVFLEPTLECLGIPERTCQEIVIEARRNAPQGAVAVTIKASCTAPPCTVQNGEVQIEVQYSNGEIRGSGMGWAGADDPGVVLEDPGEPVLPGDPVCMGVPVQTCRDLAASAASNDSEAREITSTTVWCRAVPCTTTTGSGDTVVLFADGTTLTTEWAYDNATPS